MKYIFIFLFALIITVSCLFSATGTELADYVFKNGQVYTVNTEEPWAESVAVKGNKIIFVGSNSEVEKFIDSKTEIMDLRGKMLMPGFIDGHNHLICGAAGKRGINLAGSKNKEEMLKLIGDYIMANPEKPVYMGYNWNFVMFGGKEGTRQELDAICKDKPLIFFSDDNHHAWFNTKSMELTGVTKDTADPSPGSTYLLREPDGTPSGVGVEYASWSNIAVATGVMGGREMLVQVMEELFPTLPNYGITACHEMGIFAPGLEDGYVGFDLLSEWEKEGKLKCRIVGVYGIRDAGEKPETHIQKLQNWNKKYSSELVQVTSLKIWADGTFLSHTGVQLEPYKDRPETKGESDWTADVLAEWIEMAQLAGFDTHIHVEGDGSVRRSLDAIEKVQKKHGINGRRNALHHICIIHPDDLTRFKSLGVGANATPVWFVNYKGQYEEAIKIFGQEKIDKEFAMQKKLIEMGVNVSFGSDIPGTDPEEISPLYEIQAAVTGIVPGDTTTVIPPKDRLPTLEQLLYGYTLAGAYQMHMEDKIGSIEEGKLADLIILDRNLFDVPADELSTVKVLFTMMNGKVIRNVL
jgi:predicted amidohydrolase YtcJ